MSIFKKLILGNCGVRATKKTSKETSLHLSRFFHDKLVEVHSEEQEVVIALGSNVGDRLHNFDEALQRMKKSGIHITRHACLYETEPAYVTDQPHFLNSAIRGMTKLEPHKLLGVLKEIEREMGRVNGIRYGPRPIDLDILFYGNQRVNTDTLIVPHERIWERPFVMGPLIDLLGPEIENDTVKSWDLFSGNPGGLFAAWEKLGGESLIGKDGMKRVLPIAKGADIIDLGAQSTRPMATKLSPQQELNRLMPFLETIKKLPEMEGKFISVDTFYSQVAAESVSSGAHLINDVSGGNLDMDMHNVIAALKVPYILMHMRGNPSTMQNQENLKYDDVCAEVASELYARARDAELSGIPAWRIIIDPGIGFSKDTGQNLDILKGLPTIRSEIARRSMALSHAPILIGPSRKRFLGEICARPEAAQRDPATVAAITAGILSGANIVRVHNVGDNCDAVKLCDAMLHRRKSP